MKKGKIIKGQELVPLLVSVENVKLNKGTRGVLWSAHHPWSKAFYNVSHNAHLLITTELPLLILVVTRNIVDRIIF